VVIAADASATLPPLIAERCRRAVIVHDPRVEARAQAIGRALTAAGVAVERQSQGTLRASTDVGGPQVDNAAGREQVAQVQAAVEPVPVPIRRGHRASQQLHLALGDGRAPGSYPHLTLLTTDSL